MLKSKRHSKSEHFKGLISNGSNFECSVPAIAKNSDTFQPSVFFISAKSVIDFRKKFFLFQVDLQQRESFHVEIDFFGKSFIADIVQVQT